MLTTRETASLILLGTVLAALLVIPKLRRNVMPIIRPVLRAALVPRLLIMYVLVVGMSAVSTVLAWRVGIWNWSMLKDAVVITATVVLPMTARSFTFKSGGSLAAHLVRETFGLTALLAFYLDSEPLPLIAELILQPITTMLVLVQAFARNDRKFAIVQRLCDVLLGALGLFLIISATYALLSTQQDWWQLTESLLFNFWLPLSLLPFFYIFGSYAITEKVLARFRAIRKPLSPRIVLAFMAGTRMRMSFLNSFNGRYNNIADATGFRDGLRKMRNFRADISRRNDEETQRQKTLDRNAGISGVDESGLHIDRREFDITKKRLEWIWTCQNGQWERQGGHYWDDQTDSVVDAEKYGLPREHGFKVEVTQEGQIWRAWRITPGGAVLGVGGVERRSKFYFQGDTPPRDWPGDSNNWVDAVRQQGPPDWDKNDGTRL
ncbi:hypothetical protein [Bifidobacterium crudilactis]|uniref:hypothetical protein n=1 Tax=Bifidobacterium crudilactis TaxID=327277 RepID=UPI000AE1335F|nr:hypothetical protein [Bifidobacterium crudilactis]